MDRLLCLSDFYILILGVFFMNNKLKLFGICLALAATPMVAAPSKVNLMVGGCVDSHLGHVKSEYLPAGSDVSPTHLASDTMLTFMANGGNKMMKYGAKVMLHADTSASKTGSDKIAEETMLYVMSPMYGKFAVGNMRGVADCMSVGVKDLARATGGVSGNAQYWWDDQFEVAGKSYFLDDFLYRATLPSNYDAKTYAKAAKVSWMSSDYMGLMAGISYIPDTEKYGTASNVRSVSKTGSQIHGNATTEHSTSVGYTDVFSGGLKYESTYMGTDLKVSLLGESGKPKHTVGKVLEDLRAWEVGASINYMGVDFAGTYGSHNKSGTDTAATGERKSTYWALGTAYQTGPIGVSVSYLNATKGTGAATIDKNVHRSWSIGADYMLSAGIMPYAELTDYYHEEGSATATPNKGKVFLVGTKINF